MPDISLEDWARRLSTTAGSALRDRLAVHLRRMALLGERRAKQLATSRLRTRTGRLRNDIRGDVVTARGGDTLAVRLSAGLGRELAYARAQEEGATVLPRRGRYLAIPLPPALTGAGVLRSRFARPGGLRSVPGLFPVRSKRGNLLLAEAGPRGSLRPMFVLRPKVTIRGKHFLRDALASVRDELPEAFLDAVEIAVLP